MSNIGREIKRNSFEGKYYVAIHAQARSSQRKSQAGKRHPLKNKEVFRWTVARLMRGWSPEQISGRMKLVFRNNIQIRISPEAIYSFIYSQEYKHRNFWEYLPWKRKIRRKNFRVSLSYPIKTESDLNRLIALNPFINNSSIHESIK